MCKAIQKRYFPVFLIYIFLFELNSFSLDNAKSIEKTKTIIKVKGSDSEVNLFQKLDEAFSLNNKNTSISVTGGGTETGIAALINKQTDIANCSRPLKDDEIKKMKEAGINPMGIIYAIDCVSIIVNESLPIDQLTIEQLGNIYKGDTSNWKDVGGPDLDIIIYGRQSNSGTYKYFRENVLKSDYSDKLRALNGNAQIVEEVKRYKGSIGYVGIGYISDKNRKIIKGLKVLKLKAVSFAEYISPFDEEKVNAGLYPLTRELYQYFNGSPRGNLMDFVKFELGEEGQKIIKSEGFYPITDRHIETNKKAGIVIE